MKTDVIKIDNLGNGFSTAMEQAADTAKFCGLNEKDALHLQIMTEELLSLAKSVSGNLQAKFWIETDQKSLQLHLTTETEMTREKRAYLLETATSRKNEAAGTFLGMLRNFLDQAITPSAAMAGASVPDDVLTRVLSHQVLSEDALQDVEKPVDVSSLDGYEQSILRHVSDRVLISIRGRVVEITLIKNFG